MEIKLTKEVYNFISDLFTIKPLKIKPCLIKPYDDKNLTDRMVYKNVSEAKNNFYNYSPGPKEISQEILSNGGKLNKPIKIRREKNGELTLIEGRLKFWAWIILYGDQEPILTILEE